MGRKIKPFTAKMEILDAATDGRAVAKHEGKAIFITGGVPGDVAEVHVYRKEKSILVGRIEEIETPSPNRIEPVCAHFEDCGGCKWQQMNYETQLRYKENQVVNVLRRIGHLQPEESRPIMGAPEPYFYRNKLEFSFSTKAWLTAKDKDNPEARKSNALGYHAPGFFDKIIHIDTCHLQQPIINDIRNEIGHFAMDKEYEFYNIREHTGILRNVAFRTSNGSGEIMVILILGKNRKDVAEDIFQHLEQAFPQITQMVYVINEKPNSMYSDLPYHAWKGNPWITENLEQYQFKIRPVSFFQTNPHQALELYKVVRGYLKDCLPEGADKHHTVYDLYSGTGSIGIFVSELVEKVVGIEYVQSAVDDAWENIRLNGLEEKRFSFYAGDMKLILTDELVQKEGAPDVIIADPPRQGMDRKVVEQILKVRPQHVIYVSCKPSTQARDMAMMQEWYDLISIQPVDMFPQTAHVENVALLRLRNSHQPVEKNYYSHTKESARKERIDALLDSTEHMGE